MTKVLTTVQLAILNAELDTAAATARASPNEGCDMIVEMVNRANGDLNAPIIAHIMNGANERGFHVVFWPRDGGVSIRVQWVNAE